MDQFKEKLKEGSIYMLKSFMVVAAQPIYRTPDHPYKIRITQKARTQKKHRGCTITWKLFSVCVWHEIISCCPGTHRKQCSPTSCTYCIACSHVYSVLSFTAISDIVGVVTRLTDLNPAKTNQEPRKMKGIRYSIQSSSLERHHKNTRPLRNFEFNTKKQLNYI
jgi:hypothetical protein